MANGGGKRRAAGGRGEQIVIVLSSDEDEPIVLSDGSDEPIAIAPSTAGASAASAAGQTGEAIQHSGVVQDWHRPSDEITCPICFCETAPAEAVRLQACSHSFCEDCIGTFVRSKIAAGEVCRSHVLPLRVPRKRPPVPLSASERVYPCLMLVVQQ